MSLIKGDCSNLKHLKIGMALQDQPFKNCKKWMPAYKDKST